MDVVKIEYLIKLLDEVSSELNLEERYEIGYCRTLLFDSNIDDLCIESSVREYMSMIHNRSGFKDKCDLMIGDLNNIIESDLYKNNLDKYLEKLIDNYNGDVMSYDPNR